MNDSPPPPAGDETPPGPGTGTVAHEAPPRPSDSWFSRFCAVFGLRSQANMRADLADALAGNEATGDFSAEEREMLANILRLREARVEDIMVPRADIDAVEIGIRLADLFALFRTCGHSRMPVFRETLDDPVGLIHIKDLMRHVVEEAGLADDTERADDGKGGADQTDVEQTEFDLHNVDLVRSLGSTGLVREILFVPPSMPVSMLLASMQTSRVQMALVIDEYGGTDGLVSLEDAIETVVGDIEDEHDDETGPMVVPDGVGGYIADARAELDEVSEVIGADLRDGEDVEDIDTIGGLVFGLIGRVPVRGELVPAPGGFEFEVLDADPRRIKRLRIAPAAGGRRTEGRRRAKTGAPPVSS